MMPSWQRARDLSCAALLAGEMCLVVTGLPGTGKTLLVHTVARALRSTGWNIVSVAGRLPTSAEFAALTGSAAVLIDDADRLTPTELRTLNRLRQCSVLLAGAVGFEKRCPADSRVTLAPLSPDEVATYVGLWLEQAGQSPDLVTEAAVAHLADVSAGIPRVLSNLLTESLRGARADQSDQIEDYHIDNAAWRQVEHTAARRLNRANSVPAADLKSAKPGPAMLDTTMEARLSQAPFADPVDVDERMPLVSARALAFAGFGLAVGVVMGVGLLTSPEWSRWVVSAYNSIIPERAAPVLLTAVPAEPPPTVLATSSLPEPVAAASAPPVVEQPRPVARESVPPAPIMAPVAPAPVQAPPPDPAPPVVAAIPRPSPETVEARPAQSARLNTAPAVPPPATAAAPEPLSPEMISLLNQRGQQMVELNDYSAARLLFSRAAEAGSTRAMVALGRSYDPAIRGSLGPGTDVDPAQAAQWYRKAATLGNSDAAILLQQLERSPRE